MIVIKGRSQKSKYVEILIRKEFMTNNVVILDSYGYKLWTEGNWATTLLIEGVNNSKDLIAAFEESIHEFNKYDWIVFYANADESSIADFKELDRKYPQNFIVTIQTDEGLTGHYFI
jgi:hypothetical protein